MRAQRRQRAHEEQRKARLEKTVQQQAARFDGDCGGEPFFGGGTGRPEAFAQQGKKAPGKGPALGRGGGRQQKTGRKARGRQRAAQSGSLGRGGTGGYTGAADNQLSAQKTAPPFAFAKQRGKRFACAPGGVAPASAIQRANSRKVHQYQPPHSEARRHRIQ